MRDIYILWKTAYSQDGDNYHDYLVWLAATWLEYSQSHRLEGNALCGRSNLRVRANFALWIKRNVPEAVAA